MSEAVVVGAGPNGLAAAATLATRGVGVTVIEAAPSIGGGARSSELTVPGLIHDECSATHPFGAGSPALRALGLARHGLEWLWPEIDLAHPFDDGSAATMVRSIGATVEGLGEAGPAWRRLFGRSAARFEALEEDILQPMTHLPRHPLLLARFGLPSLPPVSAVVRALATPQARALFAGSAAHAFRPFSRPFSAVIARPMPASIAPVLVTIARKPPIIKTNSATSIARATPSTGSYMPAIGAITTERSNRCGFDSTS